MKETKRRKLEAAGWQVGSADEFLELSEVESLLVDFRLALSNALREWRTKLHVSQKVLAERIESSQSRVAKMEAADPEVSFELLLRGLFALGASRHDVASVLDDGPAVRKKTRARAPSKTVRRRREASGVPAAAVEQASDVHPNAAAPSVAATAAHGAALVSQENVVEVVSDAAEYILHTPHHGCDASFVWPSTCDAFDAQHYRPWIGSLRGEHRRLIDRRGPYRWWSGDRQNVGCPSPDVSREAVGRFQNGDVVMCMFISPTCGDAASDKLKVLQLATTGVGGAGASILHAVAKCFLKESRTGDNDPCTRNAFRTLVDDAREGGSFEKYRDVYQCIVSHSGSVQPRDSRVLDVLSYVFVCVDDSERRTFLLDAGKFRDVPFVDARLANALRDSSCVTSPGQPIAMICRECSDAFVVVTQDGALNVVIAKDRRATAIGPVLPLVAVDEQR